MTKVLGLVLLGFGLIGLRGALLGQPVGQGQGANAFGSYVAHDAVRLPFQGNRTYHVKLVKGSAVVLELPVGEQVNHIFLDATWFAAESVANSGSVVVKAHDAAGVEGQQSVMHVVAKSGIRVSVNLECVPLLDAVPPSVYVLYSTQGEAEQDAARRRTIESELQDALVHQQETVQREANARFDGWKRDTFKKMAMNDEFSYSDHGYAMRVVSDNVQTFIFLKENAGEVSSLTAVNVDKEKEAVNFEFIDGCYIANRVLQSGEYFVLKVGRKEVRIRRRT
jgi:hypothetical protein